MTVRATTRRAALAGAAAALLAPAALAAPSPDADLLAGFRAFQESEAELA